MSQETEVLNDLASFFEESPVESQEEQTPDVVEDEQSQVEDESDYSDEDDGPDADEPEEDSDVDDDEPDEGDDGQPEFDEQEFVLTIDGKEVTVKGNELKSGYMRHSAFTKKTQELAEERRGLAAERTKVADQANVVSYQALGKLAKFDDAIKQAGGWANIRQSYPPEQVEQFTQMYVSAQKEAQVANALIEEVHTATRAQNQKEIQEIFSNMAKTINGFNAESLNQMDAYLTKNGFTEDMALSMTHPQAWEMVYKAMKYDQAQSRTKKDVQQTKQDKVAKRTNKAVPSKPIHGNSKGRKLDKAVDALKKTRGVGKAGDKAAVDALAQFFS